MSFECSFQSFSYKYFANISQKGGAQAPWAPPLNPPLCVAFSHLISLVFITKDFHRHCSLEIERQLRLRLLFSLKPTEMAKMRLLAIWIDQRQSFKIAKKKLWYHAERDFWYKKILSENFTFKSFFSRLFLCQNYETLEVPTRAVFRSLIWNFLSYYDKISPLSITKVLFRGFGCKIETKRSFKKRWHGFGLRIVSNMKM